MEFIEQALQVISDWFDLGIFDFFTQVFKQIVAYLVVAQIKFKIWAITFSWEVAKTILFNLHLSSVIQASWNTLDSQTLGYLNFFRVPESLNILIQAVITRMTLNLMGW